MQSHAPPRRKSSVGTVIVVLMVLGFFFLCGVVLLGAGAFAFARAEAQQARAVAQHEMAQRHVEVARAEAEMRRQVDMAEQQLVRDVNHSHRDLEAQAAKRIEAIRVANREITLLLDKQGNIKMDGKAIERKQLTTMLRNAGKGRESALTVTVKADKSCLFEHVANVLSVCQQLDIPNVKISAVD